MRVWAGLGVVLVAAALLAAEGVALRTPSQNSKERLAPLQSLVGSWKGIGQPQRGSTKNNWTETSDCAWDFTGKQPALVTTVRDGRYFTRLVITPLDKPHEFRLAAFAAAEREPLTFVGRQAEEGRWVFTADASPETLPTRITLRTTAGGDRLLVLYERASGDGENWKRLAEVGATRVGSDFGKGNSQRECVVTGGLGTIAVTHAGKTYYVCCSGCRDLFNDRPEQVLAEYKARKEDEAAKRAEKK